jgi:hypothetical protein
MFLPFLLSVKTNLDKLLADEGDVEACGHAQIQVEVACMMRVRDIQWPNYFERRGSHHDACRVYNHIAPGYDSVEVFQTVNSPIRQVSHVLKVQRSAVCIDEPC